MAMMMPLRRMTAAFAVGTMMVIAAPAGAETITKTATAGNPFAIDFDVIAGATINISALLTGTIAVFNYTLANGVGTTVWNATSALIDDVLESASASYTFLTSGHYTLTSYVTFGEATVTATINTVPGPVAAAGLPAVLGLMGFAAWRRRQNAAAAA